MDEKKLNMIVEDIVKLIIQKNELYGESVFSTGEVGIFVRLCDKFSRLKYILKDLKFDLNNEQREAVDDALLDIAGYTLIWLYYLTNERDT